MLPLNPPFCAHEPGYPTRQRLLREASLRRHVLTVLAGAALSGCTGQAAYPTPTAGAPVGAEPAAQAPADPAPGGLRGEAVAVPLGGIAAIPEPEPVLVPEPSATMGDMPAIELPEALPVRVLGARVPIQVEENVSPLPPDADV